MKDIRVVIWGLGAMGSGIARVLADRAGVRLSGGVDADPKKIGRSLGEIIDRPEETAIVSSTLEEALAESGADLCIVATSSFLREVRSHIVGCLDAGLDCITIAEEMAYPAASNQSAAAEINRVARAAGKTVLGTGINPGFVLDTLIIALTGACMEVRGIRARRVNDLSPFGPTVMKTQGVGTTPKEFERGLSGGTIVGHVGFPESMMMIARALGWKLDRIEQTRRPIIAEEERVGEHVRVPAGSVAGCNHSARGFVGDRVVLELEHPQQIQPAAAGVETGDFIEIEGIPDLSLAITPEIPGGIGTIAVTANMIPAVFAAGPGLLTMAELPVPRNVAGNLMAAAELLRDPGAEKNWREG
ncbi:MAG: 2,4-diaminopentanoate dehydrogenase [Bacillota bacterium]